MKRISTKRAKLLCEERKLTQQLLQRCGGVCEACGKPPDFKDGEGKLHLSHTVSKSQGGVSTAENCRLLCRVCHNKRHGIIEV